ncbi:hypothetical protein HMPREF0201_04461 [Cedecea davisae DSM 4568]|uniref:Uncharacterized protein n=1 Tax=Cedecea davisae DSM 4568 TaxID=566551 RepID=S3IG67_9ENTR|nr:hypothetical protein HMPREF0201_04461 [Cedecea davisae DSM 4568]
MQVNIRSVLFEKYKRMNPPQMGRFRHNREYCQYSNNPISILNKT